jgi:hypothetical protein
MQLAHPAKLYNQPIGSRLPSYKNYQHVVEPCYGRKSLNSIAKMGEVLGAIGFLLTSPPLKVCVFSEIFGHRKTKVAYFTLQFLNNYKLKPYIL